MMASELKKRRLDLGLTQLEVAERAGVSTRSVMRVETGKEVDETTLRKLCQALRVEFTGPCRERSGREADGGETITRGETISIVASPDGLERDGTDRDGIEKNDVAALVMGLRRYAGDAFEMFVLPDVSAYRQHGRPDPEAIRARREWPALFERWIHPYGVTRSLGFAAAAMLIWMMTGPLSLASGSLGVLALVTGVLVVATAVLLVIDTAVVSTRPFRRDQRDHERICHQLARTLYGFQGNSVYQGTLIDGQVAVKRFPVRNVRQLSPVRCGRAITYEFHQETELLRALPDHPRIRQYLTHVPETDDVTMVNVAALYPQAR